MQKIRYTTDFLLIILLLAACQSSEYPQEPVTTGQNTGEEKVQIEAELITSTDIVVGFNDYDSYQVETKLTIIDNDTEEIIQTFRLGIQEIVEPFTQHLSAAAEGVSDFPVAGMSLQLITIEDIIYMGILNEACTSFPAGVVSDAPFANILEIEEFVDAVHEAQRVLPNEVINGVEAKHYIFDETVYAPGDLPEEIEIDGHLYLAIDDNHLVRMLIEGIDAREFDMSEPNSFENAYGVMEYNVSHVNESFEIVAPEDCQPYGG